jgi:hypothetical protein
MAKKKRIWYVAVMPLRSCRVTIQDMDGVSHTVEVTAASTYEAVAQGLATLRGNDWVAGIAQGANVVKVSVADVRVEQECGGSGDWSAETPAPNARTSPSGRLDAARQLQKSDEFRLCAGGPQIQMNDVSLKAQRAEFMLGGIPVKTAWSASVTGTPVSLCGAWITSNCTLEILRNYIPIRPTPDTYTINLKSGFVLSLAVLLVMSQTKVTNISQLAINNNKITVNWNWTADRPSGFTYSLYGLQVFVVGPLGVDNAWAGQ